MAGERVAVDEFDKDSERAEAENGFNVKGGDRCVVLDRIIVVVAVSVSNAALKMCAPGKQ